MTSSRPYLLRALYEWIVDNNLTPYILVDAFSDGVDVPEHFIQDGKIILNIAPHAVQRMEMGNDVLGFAAMFSGVSQSISVPIAAIMAIYANENGQGMVFNDDDPQQPLPPDDSPDGPPDTTVPPKRPALKVVK